MARARSYEGTNARTGAGGNSGVGWGMPAGATIIGWRAASNLSQSEMLPMWVAAAPVAQAAAPTFNVSVPTNISTPITTQTTTAVSPAISAATGTGITQSGRTDQQAQPTASLPTTTTTGGGFTSEQVAQMLEQKARESEALTAQRIAIAEREAALRAEQSAFIASQKQASDFASERDALRAEAARQSAASIPSQGLQYTPVSLPAIDKPADTVTIPTVNEKYPGLPPGTIIPGGDNMPTKSDGSVPATKSNVTLAVIGSILLVMLINSGTTKKR